MAPQQETRRGCSLGRVSVMSFRGDSSDIAPRPIAVHKIASRYGLPPATAAVLAELAYPAVDNWRARA